MKTVCIRSSSETLTLYFYSELAPAARAEFDAHLATCADCRAALGELQTIRELLSDRAQAERSTREWAAFMRRLDTALDAPARPEPGVATSDAARGAADRTHVAPGVPAASAASWRTMPRVARATLHVKPLALAATLILAVALGLVWQLRHFRAQPDATPQASASAPPTAQAKPAGDDALRAAAMRHFERAKLVVLGLAMKDPASARPDDWEHERELAASLLPDTRLYRQFAISAGDTRLSDLLGDLETVLLQASMTDEADAPELQRLQRMIRRRDLLERMDTSGARTASLLGI